MYEKNNNIKNNGKHKSIFNKIKTYKYKNKKYSLCFIRIYTGYHHQIRASICSNKLSIVSDSIYCIINDMKKKEKNIFDTINDNLKICPRLFLHATIYKIEENEIFSELPNDLQETLLILGETNIKELISNENIKLKMKNYFK